jgi:hypothetical protein
VSHNYSPKKGKFTVDKLLEKVGSGECKIWMDARGFA